MLPQRHNSSALGSEMTISAGSVWRQPRQGSTSPAIARVGRTSIRRYGKQLGEQRAEKWEVIGMCRYRSCFPWRNVIRRWWTSSRPQSRIGKDVPADFSLSLSFPFFSFYMGRSVILFSVCLKEKKGRVRGSEIGHCHTLDRVHTD
jgi:hypothetical protein